jgi:thiol:disulfide interchange protein DsbG
MPPAPPARAASARANGDETTTSTRTDVNRRRFVLSTTTAAIATLALAACGERDAQAPAADAPKGRMTAREAYEAAASQASGFSVGAMMAANTVYVFFDPACPHCAQLWLNTRPLASQLKMVWIPVAFLKNGSAQQGATILTAADPVAAMNEHETSILERRGGISASRSLPDDAVAKVEANTALFRRTGEDSVPLVVYRNARNGQFGMLTGALSSTELARLVGLS